MGVQSASSVPLHPSVFDLLKLALPIVISRSTQVVVGITDAAMVGHLGQDALAATTTGATNAMMLFVFPMGLVFIVSSFASQHMGKGEAGAARRYGWYGVWVAALAQIAALLGLPFIGAATGLFDYSENVRSLMAAYLGVRLLSGGAVVGLEALGNYYGGIGNTRLPMIAQIIAMLLNVVFCWIFIYGRLGAPALGVVGSAIAATLASVIAFVFLFVCFLRGVGAPPAPRTKTELGEFLRMLRFGVPAGFNWFIEFSSFAFFVNVIVAGLGTSVLAAMQTVLQLNSMSFMPAFGVASACAIFVGQAIGAGAPHEVRRTVGLSLGVAAAWMALVGLVFLWIPRELVGAFVEGPVDREAFVEAGARMLMLSCGWQLFDATSMVLAETLRAAGDTAFTFWARALIAWGVFAPGAWVTIRVFEGTELGAVGWMMAYMALLALVLWMRFRSGRWLSLRLTEAA